MFFHRCSYKNNCFIELVYNFSVLVLMICSFKDVLSDLALDFFCFEDLLLVSTYQGFAAIDLQFISKMPSNS